MVQIHTGHALSPKSFKIKFFQRIGSPDFEMMDHGVIKALAEEAFPFRRMERSDPEFKRKLQIVIFPELRFSAEQNSRDPFLFLFHSNKETRGTGRSPFPQSDLADRDLSG